MKTFLKLSILFITAYSFGQVEKKFYVGVNGGYNLNTSKNLDFVDNAGFGDNFNELSSGKYSYSQGEAEFGKGFQFNLNAGYVFNRYLGAELGFGYFIGGKTEIKSQSLDGQYDKRNNSAKGLLIKPAIFFHAGFEKINPYLKVGLTIGSIKLLYERESLGVAGDPSMFSESTREFDGGIAFGYQGAFGVNYKIASKLNLVGELSLNRLVYSPKESHLTMYKQNGVDKLYLISTSDKEHIYVSDGVGPTTVDPNKPSEQNKIQADLSSIGLNIGIQYIF